MTRRFAVSIFCLVSGCLCLLAFPGALSGRTLLAPLDIFPNLFTHFFYMDPAATGIPDNHHIIDQATYDLPLQYRIHRSLREGVVPWWDPYTYGGRPLLADAHINGTDPIRLFCYLLLPFPLAYNLNLILKSFLVGLGAFLLLGHLGHRFLVSALLALCFQFSGCFALFFGHPWIQAACLYYPLLWICLDGLIKRPSRLRWLTAPLLCGLIFYSGNLQSHSYLPLFLMAYIASYYRQGRADGRKALAYCCLGLIGGAGLAAPVLLNQLEFFLLSSRSVIPAGWSFLEIFRGPLSLTGAFPWLLGTFRTLDLSKAVGSGNLGFLLFIGTSPFIIAVIGSRTLFLAKKFPRPAERLAGFLVVGYLLILVTPLGNFFYTRLSPLACLGLVVLAAFSMADISSWEWRKKASLFPLVCGASLLLVGVWIGELWAFHHFRDSIHSYFMEKAGTHASSVASAILRSHQVNSLPREVGWTNPEVLFSWCSLALLLIFLRRKGGPPFGSITLHFSVACSLAAVILFYVRFTPCQPIHLWERLREGGPAQQQAIQRVAENFGRLYEDATNFQNQVFPNALACLYGVHVVQGYSALQPSSFNSLRVSQASFPDFWKADWRILRDGSLQPYCFWKGSAETCRLIWRGPEERAIHIIAENPGHLRAEISPGPAGHLIRTDTFFPGWSGSAGNQGIQFSFFPPFFATACLPPSKKGLLLKLDYTPRFLKLGKVTASCAFSFLILFSLRFPSGKV
jgi:hypothetical protein